MCCPIASHAHTPSSSSLGRQGGRSACSPRSPLAAPWEEIVSREVQPRPSSSSRIRAVRIREEVSCQISMRFLWQTRIFQTSQFLHIWTLLQEQRVEYPRHKGSISYQHKTHIYKDAINSDVASFFNIQIKYFLISYSEMACCFCRKFKTVWWQTFSWGQWSKFCQYCLISINDRYQYQSCLFLIQKDLCTYCHEGIQECRNFWGKKIRFLYSLSLLFLLLPNF